MATNTETSSEAVELRRDGKHVRTFDTVTELYAYNQRTHSYSLHHAVTHEGYTIHDTDGADISDAFRLP